MDELSQKQTKKLLDLLCAESLSAEVAARIIEVLVQARTSITDDFFDLQQEFHIQREGLVLTPFTLREVFSPDYLQWMNDPDITETIGRPDYLFPVSRAKLLDYFLGLDRKRTAFFAIYAADASGQCKLDSGESLVGNLKAYDIDVEQSSAGIGITIGSKANWGKGLASKAIAACDDYLINRVGIRRLWAGYYGNNLGMAKAFAKNGYKEFRRDAAKIKFRDTYVDHVFVEKRV